MSMERGGYNRGRGVSRPHTSVGSDTTQTFGFGVYWVFERKEQFNDISEIWEYEICVPKPRVLVQRILCRYSGEEYRSNQGVHSEPIESG